MPFGDRSTSRQPVKRLRRFHSLCPWRTMTSVRSIEASILFERVREGEAGRCASMAEAKHVGHGIEPRLLRASPQRRLDRAAGKDGAVDGAMGKLDHLALAGKEDA